MSIERIKALADTAKQMEDMKNEAIKESKSDRKHLRIDALKHIQAYFREVAAIGNLPAVDIPCNIYWLNKNDDKHQMRITVRNGDVELYERSYASSLEITEFCKKTEEDFIYYRQDGTGVWNDGYVQLVEQWSEIKQHFERGLEKALIEKMNKSQEELANFKASYEVVANFRV